LSLFMKDTLHAGVNGLVVSVEWSWILWAAGRTKLLSRGHEGLDGFVAEEQECRLSNDVCTS